MSRQMKKIEEDGVGRKKERATSSQMVTTRSAKKKEKDDQKVYGPLLMPRITVTAKDRAVADGAVKKKTGAASSQMTTKSAKKEDVTRNLKRSLPAPTR